MMWLRLYSEARTDNKLRMLTDAQHRVWFNLLCYAGEQDERGVVACDRFLLAVECAGGDEALLAETVALLCRLGILADHDGTLRFAGWDRRQHDKPSDQREAAAERQRRSRASRDVTPLSRDVTPCHADVTPLSRDVTRCHAIDTDTDTETETETDTNGSLRSLPARARARASDDPPGFALFWDAYPRKADRKNAVAEWRRLAPDDALLGDVLAGVQRAKADDGFAAGTYAPYAVRWLKGRRWEDAPPPTPLVRSNGQSAHLHRLRELIAEGDGS